MLAVCDKELSGKTLKSENMEFFVNRKFYGDTKISEKKLAELLNEFDNINLIGNKSVGVALKAKIIGEKSIIKIAGISHAQIFKL
jgi:hypothetical protein